MNDAAAEQSKGPAIAPRSIPKKRPLDIEGDFDLTTAEEKKEEKFFGRYCQLFGMLFHGILVDKVMGRSRPELMAEFLAHLDKDHDGLGRDIRAKFDRAAIQVQRRVLEEAAIPEGCSTVWFDQLLFEPSPGQVTTIERGLKDERITCLVREMGYRSLNDLAKATIASTEKEDDYFKIMEKIDSFAAKLGTEEAGMKEALKKFLGAVITYYYFDFGSIEKFDVERIPHELRELIASAAARPDLVGLSTNDPSARELIYRVKAQSSGNTFGGTPLLDFTNLSLARARDQLNLLNLIRKRPPTVILTFVELKTHLKINETDGQQTSRFKFVRDKIPPEHLADMAHTLFAMHQYLTRLVNFERERKIPEAQAFLSVMGTKGTERVGPLFGVMKFARNLVRPPHKLILARAYFPVVNVWKESFERNEDVLGADGVIRKRTRFTVVTRETLDETRAKNEPVDNDVKSVDEKSLLHATAIVARRFIEKLAGVVTPSGREITEAELAAMRLAPDNPNQE